MLFLVNSGLYDTADFYLHRIKMGYPLFSRTFVIGEIPASHKTGDCNKKNNAFFTCRYNILKK